MRSLPQLDRSVEEIERAKALDPTAQLVKKAVDTALPNAAVRDTLHGVWLGHPLHPALILVPMGSWMSATVLDLLPGRSRDAARTLVGVGVASALPAAAAGWADWSDLHPQQQRTGLVHAAANVLSIGLQLASWQARRRGRQTRGAVLSVAALGLGSAAAYLGGHLAYRQGAMVNHAEEAPHILPEQWTPVGRLDELPDGRPTRRTLGDVPVSCCAAAGRSTCSTICAHTCPVRCPRASCPAPATRRASPAHGTGAPSGSGTGRCSGARRHTRSRCCRSGSTPMVPCRPD